MTSEQSKELREAFEAASDGDAVPVQSPNELDAVLFGPEYVLDLPWPPSMNAYWRSGINPGVIPKAFEAYKTGGIKAAAKVLGGGIFVRVTTQGKDYQNLVRSLLATRWRHGPICHKVSVLIEVWAPSKRYAEGGQWYFDVDNRLKPTLDALASANVLQNDKHVRDVRIVDRGVDPPGRIRVWIRPFTGTIEIKEKSQCEHGS